VNPLSQIYNYSIYKIADAILLTQKTAQNILPANLEEASAMLFAKSSQKIYSSQITQDSDIKFSAIIQRKTNKLHQQNKDFICKQPVFKLLCKETFIQDPKIIIYKTSSNDLDLNCKVEAFSQEQYASKDDKTIACRHISYGYATGQLKLNEIDSKEKLQQHPFFQKDYERYYCYYFPQEGYYFHGKDIGKVLQDIAKKLLFEDIKEYKSYLLCTTSHTMAVRIKFSNNYWKIKLYDPNYTIIETVAIIDNIDDITLLKANDLINESCLKIYLRSGDAFCFLSTDTLKTQFNCKIHVYGDNNKLLQDLMEKKGHYHPVNGFNVKLINKLTLALVNNQSNKVNHILTNLEEYDIIELKASIPSISVHFMPAFKLCLIKGQVATMKVYLSFILNSNMYICHKHELIGGLVHLPIKFNQVVTTVVYINIIMASDKLSVTDKFNFIASDLLLELPYIENPHTNKALSAFVNIIRESDFSLSQKNKLLPENYR
jgi:hypothetical protein